MSNTLFKPNKTGNDQDKQQVPQQAPAASGINMELLDKVAELLKGIETMNGKITDNYDIIDEMRESLKKLRDQFQNVTVPDATLDEESKNFLLSVPDKVSDGIDQIVQEQLDGFIKKLEKVLKDAEASTKETSKSGTASVTTAVNSAKQEIARFKDWCSRWLWWFIGAVIWAIVASGAFVWQCSSASSDRDKLKFEKDSLQLVNDFYSGFINSGKDIRRDFDNVWSKNKKDWYYENLDSLRKKHNR